MVRVNTNCRCLLIIVHSMGVLFCGAAVVFKNVLFVDTLLIV